ncbi:MAG: hypothetical protein V4480_05045 [Patescibacteria group bacterium]
MQGSGIFSLDDIKRYQIKYRPTGLIIDTNVLLLFLVGKYKPEYIKECGLLHNSDKSYSLEDFRLLENIVSHFRKIIVTPQVIAEISKHSADIRKGIGDEKFSHYLKSLIKFFGIAEERYQEAFCLWGMEIHILANFGFTDMTLLELAKRDQLPILTDDRRFYAHTYNEKVAVIKFEYIKNYHLQKIFTN